MRTERGREGERVGKRLKSSAYKLDVRYCRRGGWGTVSDVKILRNIYKDQQREGQGRDAGITAAFILTFRVLSLTC